MSKLKITSIGHATNLIEMDGEYLLTDPNFSRKLWIAKREKPPGILPENLPELTAITVTHAHYDHLDLFSYKYFSVHTPIVVPQGLGPFIQKHLRNPVIEIPKEGSARVGGITIHRIPVKHHGFRLCGLTWRDTAGYVFEKNGSTVYFPGDTAYGDGEHFHEVAAKHSINAALLPIGAYAPRWFMKHRHMSPYDALQAFADLKAEVMIPYHWGVFQISAELPEAPREWLEQLLKEKPNAQVKILEPGESWSL